MLLSSTKHLILTNLAFRIFKLIIQDQLNRTDLSLTHAQTDRQLAPMDKIKHCQHLASMIQPLLIQLDSFNPFR